MSSILGSQGVFFATAMAAFSGTVILFALRHQKPQFPVLRPCLSSGENKKNKKKKNKKVRFAEDVVDPTGDNEEFRRQHSHGIRSRNRATQNKGMPANRVALYNGMLRDRVINRMGYTY